MFLIMFFKCVWFVAEIPSSSFASVIDFNFSSLKFLLFFLILFL